MKLGSRHATKFAVPISVCVTILLCLIWPPSSIANNQSEPIPPFNLDVLEGYVWSSTDLFLAPGQQIIITNRDVDRHTFTVDEWELDANLTSLLPVDVFVPDSVEIGKEYEFYSSVPGDREGGLSGTITIVAAEEVIASKLLNPNLRLGDPEPRVRIEAHDDFTFQPAIVLVGRGTIIEVVNVGVISHHFVVDQWDVNQTIAPGNMVLVRVPATAQVGATVDFYCSVPGHQQQGMVGILRIAGNPTDITTVVQGTDGDAADRIDMRQFVPDASTFGDGWTRVRSGSSESILVGQDLNTTVFPYPGMGAVYVGPDGARVTLVVLPLRTDSLPVNQVSDAMRLIQDSLATSWTVDRIASAAWHSIPPPNGCTISDRVSGIVPVVTLPGGITSCQLTGVGAAIFVAVEGEYENTAGVGASDRVVLKIISGEITAGEDDE